MPSAPVAAVTLSLHSFLNLAMMPFSLLLACVLVAGFGGVILLFSKTAIPPQAADRASALPQQLPAAQPDPLAGQIPDLPPGKMPVERGQASPLPSATPESPMLAASAAPRSAVASDPVRAQVSFPGSRQPSRTTGVFQPGSRFSRSQQAFLRIPVLLSGGDGAPDFQEETATLILLPQGAVLPLSRLVSAGTALTLTLPGKPPVPCSVFGVQAGRDGKPLVEIEFSEPQKNFWPVSFPAWAGELPSGIERRASPAAPRPVHTVVLNETGS